MRKNEANGIARVRDKLKSAKAPFVNFEQISSKCFIRSHTVKSGLLLLCYFSTSLQVKAILHCHKNGLNYKVPSTTGTREPSTKKVSLKSPNYLLASTEKIENLDSSCKRS